MCDDKLPLIQFQLQAGPGYHLVQGEPQREGRTRGVPPFRLSVQALPGRQTGARAHGQEAAPTGRRLTSLSRQGALGSGLREGTGSTAPGAEPGP